MVKKLLAPFCIISGIIFYVLLDAPNGEALRWPGVSLIVIGIIITIAMQFPSLSLSKSQPSTQKTPVAAFILLIIAIVAFMFVVLAPSYTSVAIITSIGIPAGILGLSLLLINPFIRRGNK